MGIAKPVRSRVKKAELAEIFISKHPRLEEFALSPETALISVKIIRCIHVTRFQSVTIWDVEEGRVAVRKNF